MKVKARSQNILLIFLGILFIFSPLIVANFIFDARNGFSNSKGSDFGNLYSKNPKISAVSGRLHINNNWSAAKTMGVCTGNGTYSNPYIIEDLVIDGQGSGNCISIENSNDYFKIENCSLTNSGQYVSGGIKLSNVSNSQLINNNCSYNAYGILMYNSNNNTVLNCSTNYNSCGIYIYKSNNITILESFTKYNTEHAIDLSRSDQNTISGNTLNNNIYAYGSHSNTIIANVVNNSLGDGIVLHSSSNNNLTGNEMNGCCLTIDGYYASQEIDDTNLVDKKPLYYYTFEVNLKTKNFTNAGQIILVNCHNSTISNHSLSKISLFYCNNITVYGNKANCNSWGIYLYNCNYNIVLDNKASNSGSVGININYSNNNTIVGNIANNNEHSGISLYYSNNNTILGNNISQNGQNGIYSRRSYYNDIIGNIAINNYNTGIYMNFDSDNNTLIGNHIKSSSGDGIILQSCMNNKLSGNIMNGCCLCITNSYYGSHNIDNTNLVNEKPIYYYTNEVNLGISNFTNAGQVILVNCRNSIVANLEISFISSSPSISNGLALFFCDNITVTGNNVSYNGHNGIYIWGSDNSIISGNIASFNGFNGVMIWDSDNNLVSGNEANNNDKYGIRFIRSHNNNILGNKAYFNHEGGIHLASCGYNNVSENLMKRSGFNVGAVYFNYFSSNNIDATNLVNEKPLYYYVQEINLGVSNFTNAGQVILIRCNYSLISNINVSYCSTGIFLYDCNNNDISGIIANNNKKYGIYLYRRCDDNTISGNTICNNSHGLYLIESSENEIKRNFIGFNSEVGIYLQKSNTNLVMSNYFVGNGVCIQEYACQGNEFRDNGSCTYGQTDEISFDLILNILSISGGVAIILALLLFNRRRWKRKRK